MGKRFTDTAKWSKPWFRALAPSFKLAWQYLCDNCDQAGVIELDPKLANFQIGTKVDWKAFLNECGDRVIRFPNGKYWVVGFIRFQYGKLSPACRPHIPVIAALAKHGIDLESAINGMPDFERVSIGYPKGIHTLEEQEQEQEMEQDKEKDPLGGPRGEPGVFVKPTLEEVRAYCRERGNAVNPERWMNHYESNGWRVGKNPMRDWRAAVRTWEQNNLGGTTNGSKPNPNCGTRPGTPGRGDL